MTKYKVADLDGALLDAAVASALGLKWSWGDDGTLQKRPVVLVEHRNASGMPYDEQFRPSAWWSDGGPLIERERIGLWAGEAPYHGTPAPAGWFAEARGRKNGWEAKGYGETPLIAAMRAYVTSKFGDEVELP